MYNDAEKQKPNVFDVKTVGLAIAVHLMLFAALYFVGQFTTSPKETVIPIDLTVVVHENLEGEEDEPPPEKEVAAPKPEPEPEPEPPTPTPAPEPPPTPEPKVEAVERIEEPKKEPPKKTEPKPTPKPEPPKKPKKTKEQLAKERAERLAAIRNAVKPGEAPRNNGKTEKRPTNWKELLNQGYRPGATNQIAANESQRCNSLIRNAFYAKWDSPPWTDTLGEMLLSVQFGPGGQVKGYKLVKSSGDRTADNTVLAAASQVRSVPGLTYDFIKQNPTVTVRFIVKPN